MVKQMKVKKKGAGLEMRTFQGSHGTYIVFRLPDGAYHAFLETEAKAAAKDCGANLKGNPNTRVFWDSLWENS